MITLPQNLAAINWQFNVDFDSIAFEFNINEDLMTRKGVFFQFYDGRINKAGMYFGIQTNAFKPKTGFIGNAVIFSQWGSADERNIKVPENGFIQNSAHEGQFISVRKPILLRKGKYRIEVKKTEADETGEWYNLTLQFEDEQPIDCGSLKFPLSEKSGFDDGGGTWAELYSTGEASSQINENDIPSVSISITSVVAGNESKPNKTVIKYPYEKEDRYSEISFKNEITTFRIGADIQRKK